MKIIIDEREHSLYEKCILLSNQYKNVVLSREVLPLGDIYFKTNDDQDILLIERKSFSDLLSSIKDGRYEEQSYRLLNSSELPPHSIFYLLEGMFSQLYNPNDKKIILSSMTSLQYFKGFSLIRTSSTNETAEFILAMADKIDRDLLKGKQSYYKSQNNTIENLENTIDLSNNINAINTTITSSQYCSVVKKVKKDNITPENIGEIILCQIPGISSTTAMAIMKNFNGFSQFIDELKKNPQCIENITTESNGKTRKISKSCLDNIRRFLL
uniref:ERCC4 domain-containing protein n=1 Tax=viral metagenome TaxID=1070528 RepID=A0A6C0DDN2_9ZZZZ